MQKRKEGKEEESGKIAGPEEVEAEGARIIKKEALRNQQRRNNKKRMTDRLLSLSSKCWANVYPLILLMLVSHLRLKDLHPV